MAQSNERSEKQQAPKKQPYDTDSQDASFDAKVMSEEIESGEKNEPSVNVDRDYEASKQFSGGEVNAGHAQSSMPTMPSTNVTEGADAASQNSGSGDPDDFRKMAKSMNTKTGK